MQHNKYSVPLKSGLELAPLVDVVLLLLTTFLLHSAPARNAFLKIELPSSANSVRSLRQGIALRIEPGPGIYLEGRKIASAELEDRVRSLHSLRPSATVEIEAAPDVPYGTIIGAIDGIKGAGIDMIHLQTMKRDRAR